MSKHKMTFSLASLVVLFFAGITLLIPSTAEAGPPTFSGATQTDLTFTTDVATTGVLLPAATDPDGDGIDYTLETSGDNLDLPTGLNFTSGTRLITGTPTAITPDQEPVEYTYTATDDSGDTETATLTFKITVVSSVQFAPGESISDRKYKTNQAISVVQLPRATDVNNGTITYTLTPTASLNGLEFEDTSQLLHGTPNAVLTETEFTYTARAGNGSAELKFEITISDPTMPMFGSTIAAITGMVGEAIDPPVQLPLATDADGDPVTHELTPALPAGLRVNDAYTAVAGSDPITVIQGTPTAAMVETEYTWTATSGSDSVPLTFNITIAGPPPPTAVAPTFAATDQAISRSYTEGVMLTGETALPTAATGTPAPTYSLTAPDGTTMVGNTAADAHEGLMFDPAARMLSGTPTLAAAGEYTYTATNSEGSADATLTITVAPSGPTATAPVKPAPPMAAIDATNDLVINVSWTAPANGGSAITGYTVTPYEGITPGATINAAAPPLAVTMQAADRGKTFTFTVIAANVVGDSAESDMSAAVTILNLPPAAPTNFVATPGIEKAILTWDVVPGLMYEYKTAGSTTWNPATSPQEVTGLTGGATYTIELRVQATSNTPASMAATDMVTPEYGTGGAPEVHAFSVYTANSTYVTFNILFSEPMANDPTSISRLQASDFNIVDHNRTPITGATLSSAMPTAITATTGPGDKERYRLTVPLSSIPDARPLVVGMQLEVHATLDPNAVLDRFGKKVEQPANLVGLLAATYDTIPPAVVSYTSMPMTNPTGLPPGEYVEFTFTFDEEIDTTTFGPDSIDQGSSHNIGSISASHFVLQNVSSADNAYAVKVPIVDPGDDTIVVLKVGIDAVEDLHENALEKSYAAKHSATANTAPVFVRPHDMAWTWCEGETKVAIVLPLARDTEGDTLTYSLSPIAPNTTVLPNAPASDGLHWITIDAEIRHLTGKAKTTDAGGYTWTVTDEHGLTDSTTLTLTVTPYAVPIAVTNVAAMKVDADAEVGDDVDKVKLTWTDPNPTAYPNANCIPMVTSYIVTMQELNTHTQGRTSKGSAVPTPVTIAAGDPLEHTTGKLVHGTYEFTVTAVNRKGNSPVSDKAVWDKTMYHWVIVNNPPVASRNLRANQTEQPAHSVTLDWIPPTDDPNAPVNDGEAGLAMKLYGVDTTFGGYHVEVTDQSDGAITIHPTGGMLIAGDQRSYHITGLDVGEYTCRIVAWNVVGAGALSNSQDFEIDVYQPAPEDPTNTAPTFADDAEIANIVATVGTRISGRFLPKATDADGDDVTYSIDPALPAGLTFNAANRALTGTPTAAMDETAYTYKVTDGTDTDTIGFFVTVNTTVAGPPPTSTVTTMLPANGFIVYVRDIDNPPHFGTSNPAVAEWAAMPNLYELFTQGGGGSLQLTVTGTDGTNIGARKVVFSEVMWAVDEGQVGQDGYDTKQWLELRNRTATAIPISSISFVVKADGRPALAQGTDLISNVVGGGDAWIRTKGQNGNSGAADGSGQKEFISMYRKRYHNDSAGWNGGEWLAATEVYHPNHKGTPGKAEPKGVTTFPASGVDLTTVFNEIGNYPSGNSDHEWIELRIRSGDPHFEKWVVHIVTGASDRDTATNPTQAKLFQMPKLNKGRYDDILLITKTDPARDDDHPLRGGYNVEVADADQDNEGRDKNIRYYVADDWNTDLPDNGEFVLILRHGNDKTNHEKIQDIAGYHPNLKVETASFFSNLWPLRGYPAPNIALNKIEDGAVHRRQKDGIAGTRTTDKKDNADHVALRDVGWTGIGYKRKADAGAQNGGTPGYPNNALQSNETQAGADPVIISEIMYSTGDRRNITQWIELRNMSQTVGVNLDGWRLTIVNHDLDNAADAKFPDDLVKSYNINGKIPPGQTFLIVAHSGTDNTNLPSERIEAIRRRRGDLILSQYGFEITLESKEKDGSRKLADKVGNLAVGSDARVRGNPQSYEDPAWSLPSGMNDDGDRVSIVRVSGSGDVLNGQLGGAWKSFDMSAHVSAPESTYYGNRNDLSSPGYTVDGVLPVSLSKFRPERMKDTGAVVIRWITESETNNAGFNILRGEAIDGEFTKLNMKLIAGQGTTSERTVYEFPDTSAKPNVVYYYQIQDVSLDGQVQTLRTTHLRGNVTAAGKLTTIWGELKSVT